VELNPVTNLESILSQIVRAVPGFENPGRNLAVVPEYSCVVISQFAVYAASLRQAHKSRVQRAEVDHTELDGAAKGLTSFGRLGASRNWLSEDDLLNLYRHLFDRFDRYLYFSSTGRDYEYEREARK
jgi:hypothetical protein